MISLCVPIATLVSATAVASATQGFVAGLFTTPPLASVGGTQTATVACTIVMVVLGDFFALWDWMFGTLYLPGKRETFRMALSDGSHPEYRSVGRLYAPPFIKNFQTLARLLRLAN